IVQNLLDFARQRPPERHPTSIRALVDSVVALQSYSLGLGNITVDIDVPDDLPLVELDRGQLQQVLVNLTHNAVYAIRSVGGGKLWIRAVEEGPHGASRVRVTVTDDGPGVAIEHVPHLFEAFFTTKPVSDGTGLGLPVSYGIIRSHGGELVYRPGPDGVGASFTFDLPVHAVVDDGDDRERPIRPPRDDLPTGTERVAPATGARGTVLVLDDEPSIRAFLAKAADAVGFDAVVTATGADAIDRALATDFEVYLIDHQMPDMSGIDVYEAIVEADPTRAERFVLMSGDVLNATVAEFAADRGVALLAKPFDLETLERTLRTAQARGYV
ncbi:MAG TPA: ATP-binding protein, partial [Candidatus Limnocylindrales bacterium]